MQDLVALGTGNSRLMKSNISPSTTLSELISMLNNGTFPYDIGPLNAAGISQQGTALNKATLLTDQTAALLGLPNTATVDDALSVLALPTDQYAVKVTVLTPGGRPISGVTVSGILLRSGNPAVTESNGSVIGFTSSASPTLSVTNPFFDFTGNASVTPQLLPGELNNVTLQFSRVATTSATFSSSTSIRLSPDVAEFDASAIGGGQDGSGAIVGIDTLTGGKGGNAGDIVNAENIPNFGQEISIVVGGKNGTSSVGDYVTALGGSGANGGLGGMANYIFASFATGSPGESSSGFLHPSRNVGGAGGGGAASANGGSGTASGGSGGSPGGGNGGFANRTGSNAGNAQDGDSPGSGGGGGSIAYDGLPHTGDPGEGQPGLCGIEWRYAD